MGHLSMAKKHLLQIALENVINVPVFCLMSPSEFVTVSPVLSESQCLSGFVSVFCPRAQLWLTECPQHVLCLYKDNAMFHLPTVLGYGV